VLEHRVKRQEQGAEYSGFYGQAEQREKDKARDRSEVERVDRVQVVGTEGVHAFCAVVHLVAGAPQPVPLVREAVVPVVS
jgi:hypothetical protein